MANHDQPWCRRVTLRASSMQLSVVAARALRCAHAQLIMRPCSHHSSPTHGRSRCVHVQLITLHVPHAKITATCATSRYLRHMLKQQPCARPHNLLVMCELLQRHTVHFLQSQSQGLLLILRLRSKHKCVWVCMCVRAHGCGFTCTQLCERGGVCGGGLGTRLAQLSNISL